MTYITYTYNAGEERQEIVISDNKSLLEERVNSGAISEWPSSISPNEILDISATFEEALDALKFEAIGFTRSFEIFEEEEYAGLYLKRKAQSQLPQLFDQVISIYPVKTNF